MPDLPVELTGVSISGIRAAPGVPRLTEGRRQCLPGYAHLKPAEEYASSLGGFPDPTPEGGVRIEARVPAEWDERVRRDAEIRPSPAHRTEPNASAR